MYINQKSFAEELTVTMRSILDLNELTVNQFIQRVRNNNKGYCKADGRDYNGRGEWRSPISVMLEAVCERWNAEDFLGREWTVNKIRCSMNKWKDKTFEILEEFAHMFLSKMWGRIKKGVTSLFLKVALKIKKVNLTNNKNSIRKDSSISSSRYHQDLKESINFMYFMESGYLSKLYGKEISRSYNKETLND